MLRQKPCLGLRPLPHPPPSTQPQQAFPPAGKHECRALQRLAALYGLKSGVQGSSKRKFVVVSGRVCMTPPLLLLLIYSPFPRMTHATQTLVRHTDTVSLAWSG